MNKRSRSTKQLTRDQKVLRAFDMRLKGATLQECADELGVTTPTITNYVREELEKRLTP
jgi:hypothetical protein